jgi:hypothetical protein
MIFLMSLASLGSLPLTCQNKVILLPDNAFRAFPMAFSPDGNSILIGFKSEISLATENRKPETDKENRTLSRHKRDTSGTPAR